MADSTQYILGFDPGGNNAFGWSVCKVVGDRLCCVCTGVADHRLEALHRCRRVVKKNANVIAAGIDAPLFWSMTGKIYREVDCLLRKDCRVEKSRVMSPNSLRGADLMQGPLLAKLLAKEYSLKITETHPTVMEDLLIGSDDGEELNKLVKGLPIEPRHRRDATVSAFAAWCMYRYMHQGVPGWQDLYPRETCPVDIVGTRVHYFMPIP